MVTFLLRATAKKKLPWGPLALCLAAGCVDLTPPWQHGGRADSGGDGLQAILPDTGPQNIGGAARGTGGVIGSGGMDGSDMLGPNLDARWSAVEAGVDAPGGDDTLSPAEVFDSTDGVPFPVDVHGSDLPDEHIADAPVTSTGGAGQGGATATGGSRGSGGSGGATGSGGVTGMGGATGNGGAGGSSPIDAASICTGHVGIDAGAVGTLAQGLVAYYSCEQASSTSLPDSSGNSNNAILSASGTGGAAGYSFATGRVGNALALTAASKGYAALPAGILAGACEATIATWVNIKTQVDWQRVWDFGKDANVYMFLTTRSGFSKMLRFGINISGSGRETGIDGQAALPVGEWHHVAVVLGPSGGTLYVDGLRVGSNESITLRPADLGNTPNNFIGRSQVAADPYLNGSIDEFRVYNRALSPGEVQALYTKP